MPRDTPFNFVEPTVDLIREARIAFCNDLAGGRWMQCRGVLHDKALHAYCAFGAAVQFGDVRLAISADDRHYIIWMNDAEMLSLPEIADRLRGRWGLPIP